MEFGKNISYTQEVIRKLVHLFSLTIPIGYYFLDFNQAICILIPITILFVGADLLMKVCEPIRKFVIAIFGSIMRPHELKKELVLNGASWVLLSACICIFLLPKISFICGFSVLIISDTSAALIGRKFGKNPWFKNKTKEGSTAFLLSAIISNIIIGLLINASWQFYLALIIASFFATYIEAISGQLKIDDNISIPLSVGLIIFLFDFFISDIWHYTISSIL